jgi:hypothetical protein
MKPVYIKVEYNQLLEMAIAFGVRRLDAALVVHFDSVALIVEKAFSGSLSRKSIESKMPTKAASSRRTPKTPSFYAQASFK